MTMAAAAQEIARLIGVTIDPRSILSTVYTVGYPANGYTLRDVLRFIAVAHVGNWYMTDIGQLRLYRARDLPPETNYLVTQHGSAITFGGVRILV